MSSEALLQILTPQQCPRHSTDDACGARGHMRYPTHHKLKVYTSGQKRRVTPQIKRKFKRRAAIELVIGHLKEHHRMGQNHLAHASGDAINAVLAAS